MHFHLLHLETVFTQMSYVGEILAILWTITYWTAGFEYAMTGICAALCAVTSVMVWSWLRDFSEWEAACVAGCGGAFGAILGALTFM